MRTELPSSHDPEDARFVEELPSENAVVVEMPAGVLEVEYMKGRPGDREARRLMDLVAAGQSPGEAAHNMRTTVRALSKYEAVREQLKGLYMANKLPAELRREMVRAGLNDIFMRNLARGDDKSDKLAIEAAKVIGADPEVGLNQAPQGTGINISFTDIQKALEIAAQSPIPGVSGLEGDERGEIIEAEFEDKAEAAE